MNKFEEFIRKEKFVEDSDLYYSGISDIAMRSVLTEKINLAAQDFSELRATADATERNFQDIIKTGLQRFEDVKINLDTEDREKICYYFEELMDIVGLESSGGHLNEFMYGFDPTDIK